MRVVRFDGIARALRGGAIAFALQACLASLACAAVHAQALKRTPPKAKVSVRASAVVTPAPASEPEPNASSTRQELAQANAPAAQPSPANASGASAPVAATNNPTPVAPAAAAQPAAPPEDGGERAAVQQDLAQVMDELVQARARVAVLGKSLFKTRVRVKVDNRAEDQVAVKATLWLDGAPIWNGDSASMRSPDRALFDGFAAPGPHTLTVEVEQRARADEAYRYTLRNSYRFVVNREKRTDLVLVLDDDSDIAEDFKDDEEGEYDVRTRLKVRAVGLNEE